MVKQIKLVVKMEAVCVWLNDSKRIGKA